MEQSSNETTNQQERLVNLAWLAGFLEGEGCIGFNVNGPRITPRIYLINTDFVLIEQVGTILKSLNVGFYNQTRTGGCDSNPNHKTARTVEICGIKRVRNFICHILPFLRGRKREVAQIMLAYADRRLALPQKPKATQIDWEYVKRIRALNRKGPQESSETIRSAPQL
jgi:hypothetical protein